MLTIKTVENIKRGSRITLGNGIYAIVIGIIYLVFMKFLVKIDFRAIDIVWQVFEKYNPGISSLLIRLIILKCVFIIGFGIAVIAFSVYILRKKNKTAWVILFLMGLIFWASMLSIEIFNKNVYTIALSFIGWLSFVIGMVIPIRYYLEREYTEY